MVQAVEPRESRELTAEPPRESAPLVCTGGLSRCPSDDVPLGWRISNAWRAICVHGRCLRRGSANDRHVLGLIGFDVIASRAARGSLSSVQGGRVTFAGWRRYRFQVYKTAEMPISRADRRAERRARVTQTMGTDSADAALDVLELMELAWHDCYGESTPPDQVIEDVLIVSQGHLDDFVSAARLGVTDFRDLRLAADRFRA